jgi:transposase-like protein
MENDLSAAAELAKRFATEAACRDYLIQLRWPDGFRCPHCGGRENWRLKNARFECRACGRQTSATAGTIFEGTRKPLRLWFRAMECVTSRRQGASARALQGLLRLPSYQTAWVWLHKLRHAMAREDPLCGTIEVGTAELLGTGEFLDFEWHGLIIIGAEVDGTRIGRVRMRPVRNALPRYLHAFVEQCVASGSTIRTDDWHGYVGLAQKGYPHEALPYWRNWDLDEDLPGRPKYSEMPRVDWVAERLKRWLVGTHAGAVSEAQLSYYLDEFTFRFNARREVPGKLFERLLQQAVRCRAPPGKCRDSRRCRGPGNPHPCRRCMCHLRGAPR